MAEPYTRHADAAFSILQAYRASSTRLTRKAGSFLGELIVDDAPLSEKQSAWLATLLERAELPPMSGGEA